MSSNKPLGIPRGGNEALGGRTNRADKWIGGFGVLVLAPLIWWSSGPSPSLRAISMIFFPLWIMAFAISHFYTDLRARWPRRTLTWFVGIVFTMIILALEGRRWSPTLRGVNEFALGLIIMLIEFPILLILLWIFDPPQGRGMGNTGE